MLLASPPCFSAALASCARAPYSPVHPVGACQWVSTLAAGGLRRLSPDRPLLLSVRAFLAIAAPPLILRYCSCFLRLRLASLLSVPLALANRLPHLQQVACDACRLTAPLALAHGSLRLQLVYRDACRCSAGACQWVAALAAGTPRRLSPAEGYRRRSTPIQKRVAYSIKLPLLY